MTRFTHLFLVVVGLFVSTSCSSTEPATGGKATGSSSGTHIVKVAGRPDSFASDSAMLDYIQKVTLNYMWEGAEPVSRLAPERIHLDNIYPSNDKDVVTLGGSAFGVAGIIVGIERGFIDRKAGVDRLTHIVDYLAKADRFHGAWPHWLKGPTGRTVTFGKKDDGGDLVETSFMLQALLCVRQYFKDGNATEKALAAKADNLWRTVEFDWYTQGGKHVLYWHWSPTYGWQKNFPVTGYNECMVMYILAASSPTHSVPAECYHEGWARSGAIKSNAAPYDYPLEVSHNGAEATGGPLFWAHYSWFGLNPRGLKDRYANYWNVVCDHALSNWAYCIANPKGYKGYSKDCWGLTASYSPGGYSAHAPNNDLGVITPTAALSSFPYAPRQSMAALKYFWQQGDWIWGKYGFYDAFSEQYNWTLPRYLAIDQLIITPMIENYRSGLLWKLFMSCPEIQEGLQKLGF